MGYNKKTWTDGQNKYDIKTQADITVNSDIKLVYKGTGGDAISAANMNNIEAGVDAAHKGTHVYAASSAGTDSYAVTFSPVFLAYNAGMTINLKADVDNVGIATLNVDSLGAKTIKKLTPAGLADLSDKDILGGAIYSLVYDGTYFILCNRIAPGTYLIQDTTLAAAGTFTIGPFYSEYDEIIIDTYDFERETGSGSTAVLCQFNDDTGTNYYYVSGTNSYCWAGNAQGAGVSSPRINNYIRISNTKNAYKTVNFLGDGVYFGQNVSWWNNTTDRITKIKLYMSSVNFAIGSRIVVRGVKWG